MGNQSPLPTEAAPAYEDLFAGHDRPGNTASGYASIPQADLLERDDNRMDNAAEIDPEQADAEHVHLHNHVAGGGYGNGNGNEADRNADPGQPHVHCTACDNLIERKERRLNQRHCCTMLAVTFTMAFLCLFFFGLAVVLVKKK